MKNKLSKGGWMGALIVMLLILIGQTAFAADTSINWQNGPGLISDESGSPLPANSTQLIQFIYSAGGVYHSPTPGGNMLGGGDSLISAGPFYVGEGGGGAGTFYKYLSPATNPSTVYVRIWKGSASQGNRYGRSQLHSVNVGPLDAPPTFSDSFATTYIADAPPAPTNVQVSNIGYDGATITWDLNANYELTGEAMSYGTDTNATNLGIIAVSGTSYTFPRLSLDPGKTYYVKVRALNYFGSAGWSGISNFTTLGTNYGGSANGLRIQLSGGTVTLTWEGNAQTYEVWSADLEGTLAKIDQTPSKSWSNPSYATVSATTERTFQIRVPNGQGASEVVGWHTFNLKKKVSGTGINSVSIPFDTTVPGNSPTIYTASGIASSIGGNFEFIGGWDKINQTEFAYLSGGSGTNFNIMKGEGYQISVSADTTWTIVGQK